ncbi:MAG: VOC family protein [Aeromicrobium sp.]
MSRIVQVAQHADDLNRAAAFYEDLLGHPPAARFDPPGLLFFILGETRLLLERGAPPATIYLEVDDVPTRIDELRSHGVHIESEPHVIFRHEDDRLGPSGQDEWMAFIKDTEDNLVGLVSYSPSEVS